MSVLKRKPQHMCKTGAYLLQVKKEKAKPKEQLLKHAQVWHLWPFLQLVSIAQKTQASLHMAAFACSENVILRVITESHNFLA